jgi:hypothetical protein
MRRLIPILLVTAVAVLLARGCSAPRSAAPPPASSTAAQVRTGTEAPAPARPGPAPVRPDAGVEEKDERLAQELRLSPPTSDAAREMMRRYRPEELKLIGEVQRKTRKAAPPELDQLFEERRKGVPVEELMRRADVLLRGQGVVLLLVRQWLANGEAGKTEPGKPMPHNPAEQIQKIQ